MTNRRGFALIAVVWLVAALSILAGSGLLAARSGAEASRNRQVLRRAARAADACAAILRARYDSARPAAGVDSVDLGRTAWCRVSLHDPSSRLNVNQASADQLYRLLGDRALVDAVLDWRDADDLPRAEGAEQATYSTLRRALPRNGAFADVRELRRVRGFEGFKEEWFEAHFTVQGNGVVNLTSAPAEVLDALGFLGEADIELILAARSSARHLTSVDDLLGRLGPARREALVPRYGDLVSTLSFAPRELIADVVGGVGVSPLQAHLTLRVVPLPTRLAVVQREVW